MEQMEQGGTKSCNTKKRTWCFTWNNYTEENVEYLKKQLFAHIYVIGFEVGTNGTAHLQGCVKFTNPRSFNSIRKLFENNHVEPCKSWEASVKYCQKDGNFISNLPEEKKSKMELKKDKYIRETFDVIVWKEWQQNVIDILDHSPNRRTINWFWETKGNVGKSFLCEYLFVTKNALIINGKTSDVFNAVKTYIDIHKDLPEIIIADIPRDNKEYITYGTLEKLKDGVFNSGKYEGGQIWLAPLHLICLANFLPKMAQISEDRWNIVEIL